MAKIKLHELKIKHRYLVDITLGKKTFELRKNDRDYEVGDLIHFIDLHDEMIDLFDTKACDVNIEDDTLYQITYVLKNVPEYGLDKDYCILGIEKLMVTKK